MKRELRKAIKDSIKHWKKDIVEPLEQGRKISSYSELSWSDNGKIVKCFSKNCPLCRYLKNDCNICPMTLKYDVNCNSARSTWCLFFYNPTLTNARKMVKALEQLLDYDQ